MPQQQLVIGVGAIIFVPFIMTVLTYRFTKPREIPSKLAFYASLVVMIFWEIQLLT